MSPDRRDHWLGGWVFWIAHAVFWLTTFTAVMVVIVAFKPTLRSAPTFAGLLVFFGFLSTAGLRAVAQRPALMHRLGLSKIGLMVGGPLVGAVAMTMFVPAFEAAFECWLPGTSQGPLATPDDASPRLGLTARFLLNVAMLGVWCLLYFGSHLLRDQQAGELRTLEAEALASRHELRHLQSQISPHFLFNALNTVLACKQDPDAIEAVTQALAKYLRFLLRPMGALEPFGREIDALEQYLTIQSFRFGDRLSCRIDCDTDVRHIPVPPVMVQPLVENALKYGQQDAGKRLDVAVRAWRDASRLFVEVANTGRWIPKGQGDSAGTGLEGLRRRLFLHGGGDATVTTAEDAGWVRVTITLPLASEHVAGNAAAAQHGRAKSFAPETIA